MSLPDENLRCPAMGFARACHEIIAEHDCPKYVRIHGIHPGSGEDVDRFGCVDAFMPMLLIENSQLQRQTVAAVESFRNEMATANEKSAEVLMMSFRNMLSLGKQI